MGEQIQSHKDFKKTPSGWYKRWDAEMTSANSRVKKWHKRSKKIVARFLDRRGDTLSEDLSKSTTTSQFRLNLFNANVTTLRSMLYGQTPKVDVSRRFADSEDDEARVSAEMLSRILNTSIEVSGDDYKAVLRNCLDDRLLPGFGIARIRYEFKTNKVEHDAQMVDDVDEETGEPINREVVPSYTETKLVGESAPVDYVHWDDFRWGYGRTWSEIPWVGFRAFMTRDEVTARFGKKIGDKIPMDKTTEKEEMKYNTQDKDELDDAWARAEIWEIWDKGTRVVYWYCKGYDRILDKKKDPLKLYGFFPSPEPMVANLTTDQFLPQPDFIIAQDLYNEIDQLATRINIITDAVRVVGVYDKAQEGIKKMLTEGFENDLVPVDNYSAFAEKGGLDSLVDWMPIGDITFALEKLTQQRDQAIDLLYQVTGMADILRGASGPSRETAQAAGIKGKFGSIRVQALQDEFARFASDLMKLKAEIVSKHFDEQTIVEQSNVLRGFDAEVAPQAVKLLKDAKETSYRIVVRPESVAMVDFAQLRNERSEYINALSMFMQSAAPLAEQAPEAAPILMSLLKWGLAGFKGSSEIEGIIDKAIEQMVKQQGQGQKKPDPAKAIEEAKAALEQLKFKNAMELSKAKHQQAMQISEDDHKKAMQLAEVDVRANAEKERQQAESAAAETEAQSLTSIEEMQAQHDADVAEIQATHEAKILQIQELHRAKMDEIEEAKEPEEEEDDD